MGTAESSQSSELGGMGVQSSFHRQSPNVARLIRSEHSSKMEYEFPISDGSGGASHHHHHHHHHHRDGRGSSSTNHTMTQPGSSGSRHDQYSSLNQQHSHLSQQSSSSVILPTNYGNVSTSSGTIPGHQSKMNSNGNFRLWYSLTSCFGCRTRHAHSSSMNPLRDKVHAIRIVRASNDLTPAVFDSHYNIITLEQLREGENNNNNNNSGSGSGVGVSSNESCDPSSSQNAGAAQNGHGSGASSKTESDHRMKKKKKKRAAAAAAAAAAAVAHAAKTMGSEDEDGSRRT